MKRTLVAAIFLLAAAPVGAAPADAEATGDWAVVLGRHLATLERHPDDRAARLAAWRAAMRLGLFAQADALAAPLTPAEQRALDGDLIALEIRYGIIDANTLSGPERFSRLDRALTASDALAAAFLAGNAVDGEDQRRLTDRIGALAARRRPADAVALYEALRGRELPVPAWAVRDAAGSYLAIRDPNKAAALYRDVLASNPDDFDANLGLFYALVESEELDAATAHIDAYSARLPERRHRDGRYNGERLSVEVSADQVRSYADRLAEAQARIAAREAAIPFNAEVRQSAASLALARGWPQQGEQTLRRALGADPRNPSLHADLAETRLTLQEWDAARASLADAVAVDAEHPATRRARRTFELHDRHELWIDAGYSTGPDNGYVGNRDWRVDSFLYSRPLAGAWRAFIHNYTARSDFDGPWTTWTRTGVGAEWRHQAWRLTGEVNSGSGIHPGVTLGARWKPDDYWSFNATGETVTNQIPLRAVADGIYAARAELGGEWRAHESRKFGLTVAGSDFSDGNLRKGIAASWFERWYSGPRWMFETTLGADASRNSLGSTVNYFNPENDHSLWLTAAAEYLTWRSYDHSFRQRLALTGGRYWQQDYAPGAVEAVEYTHRWEIDRDVSLRYGIGRSLRPYDGVQEGRNFATLTLLWRF